MKHTSNQKVVTAAIQKHSSKALFAPYRACIALPDKNTVYAVTRENRDLWSVCIGILKGRERIVIHFTDFKSGNCHRGCVRPGSNLLPKNSGYVATCGYALQAYIPNRTEKYGLRTMVALCFGNV